MKPGVISQHRINWARRDTQCLRNPGTTQVEGGGLEVQGWGWGNDSVGKVSASEELNPKPQNPCKTEYNSIHPQQDESQRMHGGPASPAHPAEANKEIQYKTGSEG